MLFATGFDICFIASENNFARGNAPTTIFLHSRSQFTGCHLYSQWGGVGWGSNCLVFLPHILWRFLHRDDVFPFLLFLLFSFCFICSKYNFLVSWNALPFFLHARASFLLTGARRTWQKLDSLTSTVWCVSTHSPTSLSLGVHSRHCPSGADRTFHKNKEVIILLSGQVSKPSKTKHKNNLLIWVDDAESWFERLLVTNCGYTKLAANLVSSWQRQICNQFRCLFDSTLRSFSGCAVDTILVSPE